MNRDQSREDGFSLIELIVALTLTLLMVCGVFAIVNTAGAASSTLPEAADIQQRARVAADAIWRELVMAGAGLDGGTLGGPLIRHLASVQPRRLGMQSADPPTAAGSQAVTVVFVPYTSAQTSTASVIGPSALQLQVALQPNCPLSPALCGLPQGAGVIVIDPAATDRFELFTLADISGTSGRLVTRAPPGFSAFPPGATVAQAEMHSVYFDAANQQIRDYDGYMTDVPLADHVVDLQFQYFGDPRPPASPQPAEGVENCLYDSSGSAKPMPVLTPQGGTLALLPVQMLADGPWCGAGAETFDADLLRIRRIRVTIRLEAASADVRGTGTAYANPGTSRSALRSVPDYIVTFDVTPRNLNPWR